MTPYTKKLTTITFIFLGSWLLGTILVHWSEAGHPIGENYFNAFYFTVITTATIGFGDLVPMTIVGKIIAMFYAVFYVPLFLYTMSVIFAWEFHRLTERRNKKIQKNIDQILINQEEIITKSDIGAVLDDSQKDSSYLH